MPLINPKRLIDDLRKLRSFGAYENGVVRTTYSEIDMASRHWLVEKMTEAGLDTEIDGVGNVIGSSRAQGKCVLIGSHSDTQPTGGWLDGAMGVIYGLEVARTIAENSETAHLAVDVASWADEEASYLGMVGSRSFCDLLKEGEIENAIGRDGRKLTQALQDCGLSDRPRARFEADRYIGFVEAHIEQGPYLEKQQKKIGVVSSIVGMQDFEINFSGEQNHAGTTPMAYRKDAGMALIRFASDLEQAVGQIAGDRTVWTIGTVDFKPGASSIIPGKATMRWQFRDPEQSKVMEIRRLTEQMVNEFNDGCKVSVELIVKDDSIQAMPMDAMLQEQLAIAAEKHCPGEWIRMPSGAAHDAQMLARRMPAAMLFIPSINGISHSFQEDSREEDIILGCQVMTDAVASILMK